MYTLFFSERARRQWFEALEYYEKQKKGLGENFSEALKQNLQLIQKTPKHFQKIHNEYRQINVPPFPFVIVFRIDKNNLIISSIFHTKRKPKNKY